MFSMPMAHTALAKWDPPLLCPSEVESIVFTPKHPSHLECAAEEPDGSIVTWDENGNHVLIPKEDREILGGLLLKRTITREAVIALERLLRSSNEATDSPLWQLSDLLASLHEEDSWERVEIWDEEELDIISIEDTTSELRQAS